MSNKVGAKDIVKKYAPQFVFDNEEELYEILSRLIDDKTELITYNKEIVSATWDWDFESHAANVVNKIY